MAPKKSGGENNRSNKIRFVLVEADISDGNLSELTHAITSALKPTITPMRPALRSAPSSVLPSSNGAAQEEQLDVQTEPEIADSEDDAESAAPRVAKPKAKLPLPKYLPDLDLTGSGTPFKQFAEEKAPKKHIKRYLVAATWMKEYGGSETINTDKVYTMYKTAGWPLGISDWDSNFRAAINRNLMQRKSPGEYAITPLGEAALQEE